MVPAAPTVYTVIYVGERNPVQRVCGSTGLDDPAVTTVGCPDDGSIVASCGSCVGVREGRAIERVTLRKRILPTPLRA